MLNLDLSGVLPPATVVFMLEDVLPCQVLLEISSECFVTGVTLLPSCAVGAGFGFDVGCGLLPSCGVVAGFGLDVGCGLVVRNENIAGFESSVEFEVVVETVPVI